MAATNRERVGSAMDALKAGLAPFVSREFINHHKGRSSMELRRVLGVPEQLPENSRTLNFDDSGFENE